jgi:hypothetical protein
MHLTLKREATKPPEKNFLKQRAKISGGALSRLDAAVSRTTRAGYPFHDRTVTVMSCGRTCLGGRKIDLSHAFAGQAVGIREVAEKIWLVTFMHYDLGFFDQEAGRVECAQNPFEAQVLPMSPE